MTGFSIAVDQIDVTKVNINATCSFCEARSFVQVDREKYMRWLGGEFIQDVWPELDAGQRELIKTGTHPDCWEEAFRDLREDEL